MDRIGKGGSSVVMRVMAENFKLLALKRVKLDDADEAAVIGYKGEIDLLEKLKNVERVVKLYDWELDNERQILHVVCRTLLLALRWQGFILSCLALGARRVRSRPHHASQE